MRLFSAKSTPAELKTKGVEYTTGYSTRYAWSATNHALNTSNFVTIVTTSNDSDNQITITGFHQFTINTLSTKNFFKCQQL